ncbi:MAG: hypothetical protein HZB52_03565, partial [Chloroflexi bacterium]|nr:hypothetical protein [Chloroflexota bacterium]
IGNSNSKRELTDILGYGKKQICFVESKALSLLGTSLDRRSTRKSSLIEKDISKGLRQLKGAVRTLIMSGGAIYHNDTLIIIPNIDSSCIHGIVLISEMYPFLDWKNIAKDIIKYSNPQKGIFFHVIDLLDFGRIGTIPSSPITVSNLMKKHLNYVRSRKTAFIKKDE